MLPVRIPPELKPPFQAASNTDDPDDVIIADARGRWFSVADEVDSELKDVNVRRLAAAVAEGLNLLADLQAVEKGLDLLAAQNRKKEEWERLA